MLNRRGLATAVEIESIIIYSVGRLNGNIAGLRLETSDIVTAETEAARLARRHINRLTTIWTTQTSAPLGLALLLSTLSTSTLVAAFHPLGILQEPCLPFDTHEPPTERSRIWH
jgi:hypothetical protein